MSDEPSVHLQKALGELVRGLLPGAYIVSIRTFGVDDTGGGDGTTKGTGYGVPLEITVRDGEGREARFVFHTAKSDRFGHDRRADRAREMLLAYDDFPNIPAHVPALDVGAIARDGRSLLSLRDSSEFYLLTRYAPGHLYADDLRRIAKSARIDANDRARAEALADYLVDLHAVKYQDPPRYVRAVRDLLGSGEGVFGIVDGYPSELPEAERSRLFEIERRCLEWRWRLRDRTERLSRTHGDFHPFNLLFEQAGSFHCLDASRGCAGDPADDVCCLAINFLFFALETPGSWQPAFRELWYAFWQRYLARAEDPGLLEVAAPFLAWRGLVLCNPSWYPNVEGPSRHRMLGFIERALEAKSFDPSSAEEAFT